MKLVLREFISMLKESGELDKIVPDLLQNMGITPFSRAQVGVRQFGVDVAARGIDPDDGQKKLFLLTIKPGDLTRNDWHSTPQSVKPSLDDILEVYIPKKVLKKDMSLKKKIILCCGGDLKQEVQENWNGFVEKNESDGIEIEFWGADELSSLISKHFLDEYLFPESAQKQIRKTLSLIGDNDYDLSDYYEYINQTLSNLENERSLTQKKVLKALRVFNLSITLVSNWAREEKSFKKSYLASERLLLMVYKFLANKNLLDKKRIKESYIAIYRTHVNIEVSYFLNIQNHLYVRDSFYGYGADKYDYPLRTFEVIGTIACIGLDFVNIALHYQEERMNDAIRVAEGLKSLIKNNSSANSPLFDRNIIDIVLGLKLLYLTNNTEACVEWIESLLIQVLLSIQFGEFFPIYTDLYDDLLSIEKSDEELIKQLTGLSTLIPILFQWFIILDRKDLYKKFQAGITEHYSHTDFQIWYPDKDSEKYMFDQNSAFQSGVTLSSIELPEDYEEFVELTVEAIEWDNSLLYLNSLKYNPTLLLIASRHFKMPLPAITWQEYFANAKVRKDYSGLTFDESRSISS